MGQQKCIVGDIEEKSYRTETLNILPVKTIAGENCFSNST
jgi:hypothetical protein